jgi:hypothetical protein
MISGGSWKKVSAQLQSLYDQGYDASHIRNTILKYMNTALLNGNIVAAIIIGNYLDYSPYYTGYAGITYPAYLSISAVNRRGGN